MPESNPPGDQPEIRPGVVQAIFAALTANDAAELNELVRRGVTPFEYMEAMSRYGESEHAVPDRRDRELEALKLLIGDRKLTDATGWPDLFDDLSPERALRLRDLYDALPRGARAEYDRRYGHPGTI
jgi:hypothetical protein